MFRRDGAAGTPAGRSAFGLPRRYLNILALFVLFIFAVVLSTPSTRRLVSPSPDSSYHPVNWMPDSISNNFGFSLGGALPEEFDDNGRCLFLSPFEALSRREQERASQVELEQVSEGIVRSKQAFFHHHPSKEEHVNASAPTPAPVQTLTNPILALLRDGERKWKDMVSRQSKTLEQAVDEYKLRWHRNPPLGFDHWYVEVMSSSRHQHRWTDVHAFLGGNSFRTAPYFYRTSMMRKSFPNSKCSSRQLIQAHRFTESFTRSCHSTPSPLLSLPDETPKRKRSSRLSR
jgi:hypothetical protein